MNPLTLDRDSRVMVIAPHPDDETLATGGLLQEAVAAASAVRVVYITDGDNNPWPQRVMERRLRTGDTNISANPLSTKMTFVKNLGQVVSQEISEE